MGYILAQVDIPCLKGFLFSPPPSPFILGDFGDHLTYTPLFSIPGLVFQLRTFHIIGVHFKWTYCSDDSFIRFHPFFLGQTLATWWAENNHQPGVHIFEHKMWFKWIQRQLIILAVEKDMNIKCGLWEFHRFAVLRLCFWVLIYLNNKLNLYRGMSTWARTCSVLVH